jgi:hypothetical protein
VVALAKAWGEGFEASSGLMNLDVNRNLWLSRVDPKRRRHVDQHLHVPRRFEVPAAIGGMLQQDVSLEPIRHGWDDLLRVAATIDEGWRSATDVLERFGSVRQMMLASLRARSSDSPTPSRSRRTDSVCWPSVGGAS